MNEYPLHLQNFLTYLETIQGKSPLTVDEYELDLRMFFRFLKQRRGLVPSDIPFDQIGIGDVDQELLRSITLSDFYAFLNYLAREKGDQAATRARKVSCLRSYFKYLTNHQHLLDSNPAELLEIPKNPSRLPIYLSLDESLRLLDAVEGKNAVRDYAILTLFLNCGMRLSELCSMNLSKLDLRERTVRIVGKGNKERLIHLNSACVEALEAYLALRPTEGVTGDDRDAVFLSRQKKRINGRTIELMLKKYLQNASLSTDRYTPHKLRHTAATLMFSEGGVDVRTLKEILGHEQLNTTQIYTHVGDRQIKEAAQKNPLSGVRRKKSASSPASTSSKTSDLSDLEEET
ncbi:MAG: tyrosine recombinase XerC [Clostridia bacterium]|nr:tyrosine recombinase XerC [Clostridia bacterium]